MYERYAPQMRLPEIGQEGQQRLAKISVLCVGAGGLGCGALPYLVAAGIGRIGICDGDKVALCNLQRQVLFAEKDIGLVKSQVAQHNLSQLNSQVALNAIPEFIDAQNALALIAEYDYIVDASDNIQTKLLLNDACHFLHKPLVTASVQGFTGQCAVFWAPFSPCLRCVFPSLRETSLANCASFGVLGMVSATFGIMQAFEIIRLSLGLPHHLLGKLFTWDMLQSLQNIFKISHNPACPLCTQQENFVSLWLTPKTQGFSMQLQQISVQSLHELLEQKAPLFLLDVRNLDEYQHFNLGGHLIPLNELSQRHAEIPRDVPIVVYCHSGYRSQIALEFLHELGITQVKNLSGGVLAWQHAGLFLEA